VETRGIERVPESDRPAKATPADFIQIMLIWFSANLTLNNLTLGLLGPLVFYVGLKDAMWLGAFGSIAGSLGTAYMSTFGPLSGNRTLVRQEPHGRNSSKLTACQGGRPLHHGLVAFQDRGAVKHGHYAGIRPGRYGCLLPVLGSVF
jgi:hypothetical protein